MRFLALAALLPALLPSAAPPRVARLEPPGGQRGTEVEVTFRGERLDAPRSVLLLRPGLEVLALEPDGAERCRAKLRIPADCPLGAHPLRLCTERGLANVVLFEVGALPEQQEARDGGAAQRLPPGTTVNGELRGEETDHYTVALAAGARVACEVEAMRLGWSGLDVALTVRGPDGAVVARADDTALGHKDPWLAFTAQAAGDYDFALGAAFPDPRNQGPYRLSVGPFPRPVVALPCGGAPGQELTVSLLGDGAPATATVRLPEATDDGLFRYFPAGPGGTAPTPVLLRVGGPANAEPVPGADGRTWVRFPASVHGVVAEPGATVRWYFHAARNEELELRVFARALHSPLDPVLTVRAADGRYLAADDDGGGSEDALLRFRAPDDGDYSVEVRDLVRAGSPAHVFRLEGAARERSLHCRLVVGRDEEATLDVPRGGRAAGVLQLDDADPDAGLALGLAGLPAGVTAEFAPVRRGSNLVPFVLAAADDAPLQCSLAVPTLTAGQPPAPREPGYAQLLPLVKARNDQPLLAVVARRLPVAVTAPVPVAIEIAAPAVPLVRGGPLDITLRIRRREPFTGDVRVRALWTPPGVGAGQVTIGRDATSAVLPLDAGDSAALGGFPLAVVATGGARGDAFTLASAFVPVTVEQPWVTAKARNVRAAAGTHAELPVVLEARREWTGRCKARLLGLPRGVAAEPIEIDARAQEAAFALTIAADAQTGRHRGWRIELRVPQGDAEVVHRFPGAVLRIDAPAAGAAPKGAP